MPTEVNYCLLTNLFRMASKHSQHKSYESCVVVVVGAVQLMAPSILNPLMPPGAALISLCHKPPLSLGIDGVRFIFPKKRCVVYTPRWGYECVIQ